MKKILVVITSGEIGGIEKLNYSLGKYFSENKPFTDLEIKFFFLNKRGVFYEKFPKSLLEDKSVRGKDDFFSLFKIFKKYDVIHFQSFMPTAFFVAKIVGRKIIYTEHGNFSFFRKLKFKEKIKRFIMRHIAFRLVDFVIFNSEFSMGVFCEMYHFSKEVKRVVIHNFYHLEGDVKCEFKRNNYIKIGFIGRIVRQKRLDRFFNVSLKIFKKRGDARFLIAGDGPEREKIKELFINSPIGENAKFLGFIENIEEFFGEIDFLLFTSEKEPFGISALEGIVSGVPTFAFRDGGGVVEIFNECNGMVFVCEDEEEMAQKVVGFRRSDWNNFLEFRKCVKGEFSIGSYVEKLMKVYKRV